MRVICPDHGEQRDDQHERSENDVLNGMPIFMNPHFQRVFWVYIWCKDEQSEAESRIRFFPTCFYRSPVDPVRAFPVFYEEEQAD